MNNQIDYGRSIGAIVGGYLVMTGTATIFLLLISKLFLPATLDINAPPTSFYLTRMILNIVTALLGGYVAGVIAKVYPLVHAMILAGIIFVIGVIVILLTPRLMPGVEMPLSTYTVLSALLTPLSVVVGGWLRSRKNK